MAVRVFERFPGGIQKAHLRARAAKGAESRFEEERTRAEESRNSISPAKARPERALMRQCGPRRRSMLRAARQSERSIWRVGSEELPISHVPPAG